MKSFLPSSGNQRPGKWSETSNSNWERIAHASCIACLLGNHNFTPSSFFPQHNYPSHILRGISNMAARISFQKRPGHSDGFVSTLASYVNQNHGYSQSSSSDSPARDTRSRTWIINFAGIEAGLGPRHISPLNP